MAQSLRSEVVKCVEHFETPVSNIKPKEKFALNCLQRDKSIVILPPDKGRATVIMDANEYDNKINTLLEDSDTYLKLNKDPTAEYKRTLVHKLRTWQRNDTIDKDTKYKIYPTTEEIPKIYGTPKIHKPNCPLRPIVSSIDSISYGAAKYLSGVLGPMVGDTPYHIVNSGDFVSKIKDLEVPPGQTIVSFDVCSLFTSIPVQQAVLAISDKLDQDVSWTTRSTLDKDQLLQLLQFCLDNTYFVYRGTFYKQQQGTAMGSPISPIVANLYMEKFELRAITTAAHPPILWYRYVDDTFVKINEDYVDEFLDHVNQVDPHIKFTIERAVDDKLAFLDTCIHIKDDGGTKVTIYRKPTHTDSYLNFNSNHHLQHKRAVVRTLLNRADNLVTETRDKTQEKTRVKDVLRQNDYSDWILNSKPPNVRPRDREKQDINISIPYVRGLSEKLTKTFRNHGVGVYHKPFNTLRNLLVHPKDKSDSGKKCGVVYEIDCPDCPAKYIGETARTLDTRLKEHRNLRSACPTAVGEHRMDTNHDIGVKSNVKILARENHFWSRKIRESVEIMWNNPSLNRDRGYDIPLIYQRLTSCNDRQMARHSRQMTSDTGHVSSITPHCSDEGPRNRSES